MTVTDREARGMVDALRSQRLLRCVSLRNARRIFNDNAAQMDRSFSTRRRNDFARTVANSLHDQRIDRLPMVASAH